MKLKLEWRRKQNNVIFICKRYIMINKRYKSMIRTISTINKLIDNLLVESNKYDSIIGKDSGMDKESAKKQTQAKGKEIYQKIRSNLAQFKELETEIPQSKDSSVTYNLWKEIGSGTLRIKFSQINPPKLEDNDGSDIEPQIGTNHVFKVKGYGGKGGDFIKIEGDSGALSGKVFLLNFVNMVTNNEDNKGEISHCNNTNCDKKGPLSQWQGRVQW